MGNYWISAQATSLDPRATDREQLPSPEYLLRRHQEQENIRPPGFYPAHWQSKKAPSPGPMNPGKA